MRLYLDNCCFNRPFDDQTQLRISLESQAKLAVQSMILAGKHTLVWSYILEYEDSNNENEDIITTAEQVCKKGIKTKDALHIACAIASEADYFLTTDMGILKKDINGIKIVNPIDFIRETEEL